MKENLGKHYQKITAPMGAKIFLILIMIAGFVNFYGAKINHSHFTDLNISFLTYIFRYPSDFFSYLAFIVMPALYYGFIRGLNFYEKGMIINRGLPFFNRILFYENIEQFRVVNEKYLLAIKLKATGDEILFTVSRMDRTLAILDQRLERSQDPAMALPPMNRPVPPMLLLVFFSVLIASTIFILQYFPG
jgi:hypothetical protein